MLMRLAIVAAGAVGIIASCDGPQANAPPMATDPTAFTGRVSRVVDGDTS